MSSASQSFKASAIHPSLGSEVASGTFFFDDRSLHFQSTAIELEIPLDQLIVESGKGDDDRIFFSDPDQPGLRIISPDTAFLERRAVPQIQRIREQLTADASRRELSRRVKIVLGFLAACVLIAWLGSLATGVMVRSIVAKIPPEFEQEYGDDLLKEMAGEVKFIEDTNRVAQLAVLAAPLLKVLPKTNTEYRFHLVEDEEPNAFALPGGHIIVRTGLLKLADRPEAFLGVLAHEVAHVTQKHGFRKVISSAGPFLICEVFLGGRGGVLGVLGGGSALLVSQSFSQEYEIEADDVGWQYLVAANIDPRGMTDMFRKLKASEGKEDFRSAVPQAFSSHPALEKRIARLETKWKKLSRRSGFVELKPIEQGKER